MSPLCMLLALLAFTVPLATAKSNPWKDEAVHFLNNQV